MKKTLLPLILIVTLLSNITISYAQGNQGNQPFWKINGNSNISSENFMGTLNNQDLVIKTDNIRRVIIQKDGLTLFKDKVTVNGIGHFKNRLIADDVTRLKNKLIVDSTALFKDKVTVNGIGYFKNRLIVDDITRLKSKLIVDSTALFKDKVTVNSIGHFKNRLIVDDVTRLKNKLIVDSTAVIKGKIRNNYLSGSGIVLLKADNNGVIKKFLFPGDSTKVLRGDGTFSYNNWQLTGNNLFLLTTGNIGIGVTNPTEKLDISGNVKISGSLTNGNDYVNIYSLWQHLNNINGHREIDDNIVSDTTLWSSYKINTQITNTDIFDTLTGNALISKYIKSDTLAIGVDTAMEMLDVNGNANIRGKLYVYDGVIIGKRVESQKSKSDTLQTIKAEIKHLNTQTLESEKMFSDSISAKAIETGNMKSDTINTRKIKTNSIIIDGLTSKIFSTSGLIDFMNTNLETTGSITASIINVGGKLKTKELYADTLVTKEVKTEVVKADSIVKVANSIIIDGINDRITSTSGTINFDNINLKGINKITADSINIGNMNVTGLSSFDSLHVQNKIKIGNSIVVEAFGDNSIYTDNDYRLYIQSIDNNNHTIINAKNEGRVGIGTIDPLAKLHVDGNSYFKGKVGIGIVNPQAKLHVYGKTTTKDFQMTNGAADGYILQTDASGNASWVEQSSLDDNDWTIDGDNIYRETGKVGIGTTEPQQILHLKGFEPEIQNGSTIPATMRIEFYSQVPSQPTELNPNYWDIKVNNKGLYFINPQTVNEALSIRNNGKVGIGTNNPNSKLYIKGEGDNSITSSLNITDKNNNSIFFVRDDKFVGINTMTPSANLTIVPSSEKIAFNVVEGGNNKFYIMGNGYTWINNKLYVEHDADTSWAVTVINNADNGKGLLIKAGGNGKGIEIVNSDDNKPIFLVDIGTQKTFMRGFKSTIQDFPDYVLEENYNLMPLKEKEKYWKQHKHLLGFPTAKEVKQEVDIPELIAKQMKEIEEIYLHLVELKKENEKLKQRIELLEQKK